MQTFLHLPAAVHSGSSICWKTTNTRKNTEAVASQIIALFTHVCKDNVVILSAQRDVSDTKPACNGPHEAPI